MADITNKNELKRRIELFLDELDYSINEDFCKETMKMMREFIGHASHRLDCEDSRVKSLKKKLKEYKDLEEQGLLLRLPIKVGDMVYVLCKNIVTEKQVYDVQYRGGITYQNGQRWYVNIGGLAYYEMDFGKTVFLTQEEAEQKLKEKEIGIRPSYSNYSTKRIIERLAEYEDLEEKGLMARLPVPIGTTVYEFEPLNKIVKGCTARTIIKYTMYDDSIWFNFADGYMKDIKDFGKTVFLTREAAEQKLKEIEQKANDDEES